jgi:hypothetical protein
VLLSGVHVIDLSTESVIRSQDVLISGNAITHVIPHGSQPVQADRVVTYREGYVIPGLWDMHVHVRSYEPEDVLPMFVAEGVTGIRDLGLTSFLSIQESRAAINAGALVGPRIISSGVIIEGPNPRFASSLVISSVAEVPSKVDSLASQGVEIIKLFENLPPDVFREIVTYATKKGLLTAGHIPTAWNEVEAANTGLGSIEHFMGLGKTVTFRNDQLDKEQLDQLAAALTARNTFECPTLINGSFVENLERVATEPSLEKVIFKENPSLTYSPRYFLAWWDSLRETQSAMLKQADYEASRASSGLRQQALRELSKRGVKFLAGTDTPNPYLAAGISLHDELDIFVKAGLTAAEALRTAIVYPAQYFRRTKDLGAVAPGYLADLLVLSRNPLADISATRSIEAVVANGRLFSKQDIAEIKASQLSRISRYSTTDLDQAIYMEVRRNGVDGAHRRFPDPLHNAHFAPKPEHLLRFSELLLRSGEAEEARKALEWNIELFPNHAETKRHLDSLSRQR